MEDGAEESVVIIAVVEGTLAAMGIFLVVAAAAGGKGAKEARAEVGEAVEAGEVVCVSGVAGVEETEGAEESEEAQVLVGAVGEVEAVVAKRTAEAIELGDAVEAREVVIAVELIEYMEAREVDSAVGEVKVIGIAAGAGKWNIVQASGAAIHTAIRPSSLPCSNVPGSSRVRPSIVIAFQQSRLGSVHSNIAILSCSAIIPCFITTPLMRSNVSRQDISVSVSCRSRNSAHRLSRRR